jgi:hypothetical protein
MKLKAEPPQELIRRLKDDLEKTLEAHRTIINFRARKMEQDREQLGVYFKILESETEGIKLNSNILNKINKTLAWNAKVDNKIKKHSEQQDAIEKHLLELQKVLVNLLSKRFKY